ncbi:MAG TPA: malectin domain-containing carbohydrate-binding protein [Bryobacteraceae bacterium]|nr:malectin domain-containing carbohydrate-binding protein [Bryobacteraceae bacterium]
MGTTSVSPAQAQAVARRVTASKIFARNPRLIALLNYLCEKSLAGAGQLIKEYDIATDVFQRPPAFDQTRDAIVRVEMHRLRKKLREYYASEGSGDSIEITLQAGKYLPDFVERTPAIGARRQEGLATAIVETPVEAPAAPLSSRRVFPIGWVAVALLAAGLGVAGSLIWLGGPQAKAARESSLPPGNVPGILATPVTTGEDVRILCGAATGRIQDREGNVWNSDTFYSGGSVLIPTAGPVFRTRDAALFHSARSGDFSYRIPLKPGSYELRLYFADANYHPGIDMDGGEGTRIFTVRLNGVPLLRDFDIIAEAGPNTADVRVFKDVSPASDGYLHLAFFRQVGEPILNAIEISPGIPHRLRPIRIATQDRLFMDRSGVEWGPDDFFLQGRISSRYGVVAGPYDPQIYERERYGNFSYAIPVAPGRYAVTLYFAESFWGPDQPGGGGAGSRIFDVYCNGTTLLRNFDMFKETGADHQLAKTFHGLTASPQGTLLISFVPVKNYANLSAIQVLDEGAIAERRTDGF